MNKPALVAAILAQLDLELDRFTQSARTAQAAATDGESKAENKYDTRGLEASYLAHGQSLQAKETEIARRQIAALAVRDFAPDEPITPGALVELAGGGERLWYFVGPAAGGTEVAHAGCEVYVITPASPLGRELIGQTAGARVWVGGVEYRVGVGAVRLLRPSRMPPPPRPGGRAGGARAWPVCARTGASRAWSSPARAPCRPTRRELRG